MTTNNQQNANQTQNQTLFSIPVSDCLMIIILSAIAGISINECKRSKLRLENDRMKYQRNDTIAPNATARNTLYLKSLSRAR